MLTPRLVFGCARLTGGPFSRDARDLVERALEAGFRHFDTAPSYGIGTAEKVIGKVVGTDQGVEITAKVGSARPTFGAAKSVVRQTLRLMGRSGKPIASYAAAMPGSAHKPDGCFDRLQMEQSLALTLANLRRSSVNYVLLHESYRMLPPPELTAFLDGLIAKGITEHVGFANSAVYDVALHDSCPRNWIAQAAIHPDMLLRPVEVAGPVILHSLVKTHRWLRSIDQAYSAAAIDMADKFAKIAPGRTLDIILPYYLAAKNVPNAKLIYATSEVARLHDFIAGVTAIDAAAAGSELASDFSRVYGSYAK